VEKIMKELKNNKTPGPDKIENETIKALKNALIPILTKLFSKIIETHQIPEQWNEVEIILLYKKGDRNQIGNYRPISLSSNINKIFTQLIKNRVYDMLDMNQGEEQAGFRRGYSTVDHIFTMNQLIEKTNEYGIDISVLLIDFNKAFDSVKHTFLWQAMANQGVPKKWIEIIAEIYKKSKAHVKTDRIGPTFKIGKGVRQGDPLSANLFNCALEEVFRGMNWGDKGIKIDGKYLNNLRFADDVVLIGASNTEVQEMFQETLEKSGEAGLTNNIGKTVLMNNIISVRESDCAITVGGTKIERRVEGKYLGQIISFENRQEKELKERRKKAWNSYWSLKQVFKNKELSVKSKIMILEACTIPVLTYGAQTWSITKTQLEKLRATQRSMERSILGVRRREKVPNNVIRERTGMKRIGYTIRKMKFKYAGHVVRGKGDRWNRRLLDWTPYGEKRKKGRPRKRCWREEIEQRVGGLWQRCVENRKIWRNIGEAYAQEWAE